MGSRAAATLLLVSLIFLLRSENCAAQLPPRRCGAGDLEALRGFSGGLDAAVDGWPIADDDCCAWPGVVCGRTGSAAEVIGVVLPNRTLRGEVSASLAGLSSLRVLNLSSNALRGPLPAALLRLRRLEVLDVSGNTLSSGNEGTLLFDLPALRVFNVSNNAFTGTHPVLRGSLNLTHYDASGNSFDGALDAAALCGESPGVRVIRLSMNRLSGALPVGFGQCRSLVELALDGNGIGGTFPDDLFVVESMQVLSIHTNSISGELSPLLLRNLTSLVRLDISFNAFTGPLPDIFDSLFNLQEFSAPSNRFSGKLPPTLSTCRKLRVLNFRNNTLHGEITNLDFRKLSNLAYLDLGVNSFTGSIPASLPEHCKGMTALNLGRNRLTGEIPASFSGFDSLSFLSLTGNSFTNITSALRTLQSLPNLTSLVLTNNFHGGRETMPSSSGIIKGGGFPSMQVLVIANCELRGTIPSWIAGLRKLRVLDISWNRLTGRIPPWIGEFDRLFYLDVSNNSLQGEVPGNLARLPGLKIAAAGLIDDDSEVQDFPFFMRRNTSVKGRQYNQVNSFPPSLVLSHNNLSGGVPKELGELTKVHIVDLSWNMLSGPIPPELSGMRSLESLDLSHNSLSGPIPASLTKLSFLSHLDVSHNNLSGQVPVGGQFSTFSRQDFEGNPFLCGIHAAPCVAQKRDPPHFLTENKQRPKSSRNAGVVAAISVGTALLLSVAAAVTWRVWSKRRQEDNNNARVAADDDLESSAAAKSTMVLLFPTVTGGKDEDEDNDSLKDTLTVEDVVNATGNFDESRIIGCGGFGMVYRATLPDGRDVAVKRLSGDFYQMEREFRAEVETLSRVRHANLVPLQGYCRAGSKDRLLIYPFMENGSLDHWLHERQQGQLTWPARLGIARGAARGLAHLHATSEPRVLHRDVKSSNILLDARMEPRLADFGLARLVACPTDTHVTTDLVGTLGYIPPEYGHSSVATYRGDVYSLGVVLLELVTGRRPVDMTRPVGEGRDVTSWALRLWRESRGHEAIDKTILGGGDDPNKGEAAAISRMLDVACACVNENPKSRPTAQQVVEWLDAIAAAASPAVRGLTDKYYHGTDASSCSCSTAKLNQSFGVQLTIERLCNHTNCN